MPPETGGLFLLGMFYGTTVCSLTCLPYLGPYLMGQGNGFQDGLRSSLVFLLGKLTTYSVLGGIAAMLGRDVTLTGGLPLALLGALLVVLGATLPFVNESGCPKVCRAKKGVSLFSLGIVTSLVPCPPLVAVFLLAAREGNVATGISYGFVYGLGLLISPLVVAGGGLAMIAKAIRLEAPGFAPYLKALSAMILIVMGFKLLWEV